MNKINRHIGKANRLRSKTLGLSLEHVTEQLGISQQQLQKYETGSNRISGSRMWDLSQVLQCQPDSLFPDRKTGEAQLQDAMDGDGARIAGLMLRIKDPQLKQAVAGLVGALGRDG